MYFVRSDTGRETNQPANYSVITPSVYVHQLQNAKKDCEGKLQIQQAIDAHSLMTFEHLLEAMPVPNIHVIRKRQMEP